LEKEEKVGKPYLRITLREKLLPRHTIHIQRTKEPSVNGMKFIRWVPWVLVVIILSFPELRRFFIQWFLIMPIGWIPVFLIVIIAV